MSDKTVIILAFIGYFICIVVVVECLIGWGFGDLWTRIKTGKWPDKPEGEK